VLTAVDRRRREDGFTVVEVLVALTLLAVVAAAVVPLLAIAGSAAVSTRSHTRAKNLAQERIEQMRQLPFQIDKQNGDFIDLLDYYYPNLTAATSSTATGWVSSTSTARVAGEPATGSFYRTRFATLAGQPGFSQTVALQFLDFSRVPVPDNRFSTYRHDVEGADASPSTLLGATVLTYWTHGGKQQTFRTFTQIGDTGDADGLLISQASAVLLRLESALDGGASITSELLSVTGDGRLSDGSVATARATAGRATKTGTADLVSANAVAVDPPNCQGSSCPTNQPASGPVPGSGVCDYASFGRTRVDNVTATTADGLPRVPATVEGTIPPATQVSAGLLKESGSDCGPLTFDNTGGLGASQLRLAAGTKVVSVDGTTESTGSTPIAGSSAWVSATAVDASPRQVTAGASVSADNHVRLFPTPEAPEGVLKLRLVQGAITCNSSTAAPTASYTVTAQYWNAQAGTPAEDGGLPPGAYVDLLTGETSLTPITWSTDLASFSDPFAGIDLSNKVVHIDGLGAPLLSLVDYLDGPPRLATGITADSTNGLASIGDAVLSLTTKPLRAADPLSSIGLKMGKLSCVAVDQR
jgi:prepilin-type N-terminal cleavage/methylation domain-containing protein